jgi:hypothetical protein
MTFLRRLGLYGFGFVLGLMILFMLFGTRRCEMPGEIKLLQLLNKPFVLSPVTQCKLKCLRKNEALMRVELKQFEIDYGLSSVHEKPCGAYFVKPQEKYAADYAYRLVIYDCGEKAEIRDLQVLGKPGCECN